jgi:HEPN domain
LFDPIQFGVLAGQLVIGSLDARVDGRGTSDECRLRAALGRAYYALYLATRATIVRKHGVSSRWMTHGLLHTTLRRSKAGREAQTLGYELRRLYALRQQADYELVPTREWQEKLTDRGCVDFMTKQAIASATALGGLDFGPVAALLGR